jgi:hypothetical protein
MPTMPLESNAAPAPPPRVIQLPEAIANQVRELKDTQEAAISRCEFGQARDIQDRIVQMILPHLPQGHWELVEQQLIEKELIRICTLNSEERHRIHVAALLMQLAGLRSQFGDHAACAQHYDDAASILKGYLGDQSTTYMFALEAEARLLFMQDKRSEARRAVETALKIRERLFRMPHPAMAAGLKVLAAIRVREQDLPGAEKLLTRALSIEQATLPAHHVEVAVTYCDLAQLRLRKQDFEHAEEAAAEGVAICRALQMPEPAPLFANCRENLALARVRQNKLQAVEPMLRDVMRLRESREDFFDARRLGELVEAYETVLAQDGETEEGAALLRRFKRLLPNAARSEPRSEN